MLRRRRGNNTNDSDGYNSSPSQASRKTFNFTNNNGGTGNNRRRRFKRSSSKDSDISMSERSFPEPPSYNQPAHEGHQIRTMASSNHSRQSSDDEFDLGLYDSDPPPPSPPQQRRKKKKKGLRKFLGGGRKKKKQQNAADESQHEYYPTTPQGRRPQHYNRKYSNDSDTDYRDRSGGRSNGTPRRGIQHMLSFGRRSDKSMTDDDDNEFFGMQDPSQSHNPNESEYDRDGTMNSFDSGHSYNLPMKFGDEDDASRNKSRKSGSGKGFRNRTRGFRRTKGDVNRPSVNQSEHLQMSFGSNSMGSLDSFSQSDDDDFNQHQFDYTESEEFSLNMMGKTTGGPLVDRMNGSNNNSAAKRRGSSVPADSINYRQVNRHKKDLASQNLHAIESMARKEGPNHADEAFLVMPDHAYPNTRMTRTQLRKNMNARSAFYHDLRLASRSRSELGQLRLEIMQCFGLPTTSLVREVSAYAVAVHGGAAFQTDVIPNVANPMWLSKMRRACLFPVQQMYSQLCIGIFDLEAVYADPSTVLGHPGHPGWVPPEERVKFLGRHSSFLRGGGGLGGSKGGGLGGSNTSLTDRRGSSTNFTLSKRGSSAQLSAGDDDDEDGLNLHKEPNEWCTKAEDFIGHVVIDICRLRPGSTYDITLPLRRSKHVFTREPQGSVRVRLHLEWGSERSAVLSYLPKRLGGTVNFERRPNTRYSVNCVDDRAARNVAHAVHGIHMPGKFDMTLLKSTIREIHWTRIHLMRYCKNREIYHLAYWVYPSISGFVFLAWMHAVCYNTVRYIPGHVVVFLLLHLLKNYAHYAMDSPLQNGFLAPTLEELYAALLRGTKKRKLPCIEPLTVERQADPVSPLANTGLKGRSSMDELYDESGNLVHVSRYPLADIAEAMKKSLESRPYRKGFTVFKYTFQGDDAVDFLILKGFAMTREEAVSVGRRLEREKRLFQHVSKDFLFEDSSYIYTFLDSDTDNYLVKSQHSPLGAGLLELLGFYNRKSRQAKASKRKAGGADILEARECVEFPFASGVDHPRFTVKESLVIRSAEEKFRLKREDEAKTMCEVAEFGIVPTRGSFGSSDNPRRPFGGAAGGAGAGGNRPGLGGYESETGTKATGAPNRRDLMTQIRRVSQTNLMSESNIVGRTARRGSAMIGATANVVAAGANAVVRRGHHHGHHHGSSSNVMEVATGEAVYAKLKEQNNATLNKVLELQRKADEYDPYEYDSDNDVKTIHKKKRKKHIVLEKHLKKPISQEFSNIGSTGAVDMSLGKALLQTKRHIGSMSNYMFEDQLYKIDRNIFPIRHENRSDDKIKKKKKRGLFSRKANAEEAKEEEERQKQQQMSPYQQQQEKLDKCMLINHHSHWNPWMNRIAIVMQPLLEMAQSCLFVFRALFNLFTWQDPVLCFWLCMAGPPLAIVLYICPYRLIFGFLGVYWIGPQNYVIRIYRESKEGYEPPNFDMIVKTKKLDTKNSDKGFEEMQFFSSEAPGNQQIQFRNIDPQQVKQIVVPSNVMMYGRRFYTWPPEPKYARVYASEAPTNLIEPGFVATENGGYESDATSVFTFDQAARNQSKEEAEKLAKKKRKGTRVGKKITSSLKKTTQIGGAVGEQVLGATAGATVSAAKGTANMTRSVVRGTGRRATSAAKGTGNFLRLRKKHQGGGGMRDGSKKYRQPSKYYSDDDSEYSFN